jgi:hypothetical protein
MSPATLAAIPIIIQLIQAGVPAVVSLINWLQSIRTIAQQSSEWTPEMESAFMNSLIATISNPIYWTDEALAAKAKV